MRIDQDQMRGPGIHESEAERLLNEDEATATAAAAVRAQLAVAAALNRIADAMEGR
ncbi:hypothetical protein [Amycolatopsis sp. NPDC058986]|uniref:hypothetical protein n=1 Tax=unclassified Amycolatopsis TaxID=2618356 RepID=UPI0036733B70